MDSKLDLDDIQGNIIKAYGHYKFIKVRYVFYKIKNEQQGRLFIAALSRFITTAEPWKTSDNNHDLVRPEVTTNVALTYSGLKNLGLPRQSLQSFPDEFAMGMKARHNILGDDQGSAPEHWDPIWLNEQVHILVSINGQTDNAIADRYAEINSLVENSENGVALLSGHRASKGADNLAYQEAGVIFKNKIPTNKEHFGFSDGISDPFFKGTGANPANVIGAGKPTGKDPASVEGWEPLATGEFILGHADEAFELPKAPKPRLLSFNGSFMVYRKLHQNVGSFNRYLKETGKFYPGGEEALAAKFVGRWRNGAPITRFPNQQDSLQFDDKLQDIKTQLRTASSLEEKKQAQDDFVKLRTQFVGFDYNSDLEGARCPLAAHIRRSNPRGSLQFGAEEPYQTPGALTNRRRILRRGLPYGEVENAEQDDGDHGIIFMAINADIKRQFEFVQQQWINYGNDFKQANDKDPILGNHGVDAEGNANGRMVIETDPNGDQAPFFCSHIPRFVETRGGDYFFIPSLTALRMIGEGIIDPT